MSLLPNTDLFSFLDLSLCQHLDSAFFRVDNVPGVGGAAVVDQRVDREVMMMMMMLMMTMMMMTNLWLINE